MSDNKVYYAWGPDVTNGDVQECATPDAAVRFATIQLRKGYTVAISTAALPYPRT